MTMLALVLLLPTASADLGPRPDCPPGTHAQYMWGHNCVRDGYVMVGTDAGKFEVTEETAERVYALDRELRALPEGSPPEERERLRSLIAALVAANAAPKARPAVATVEGVDGSDLETLLAGAAPPQSAPPQPPPQASTDAPVAAPDAAPATTGPPPSAAPAAPERGCSSAAGHARLDVVIAAVVAAVGSARRRRDGVR
jgi:hypothetical protein